MAYKIKRDKEGYMKCHKCGTKILISYSEVKKGDKPLCMECWNYPHSLKDSLSHQQFGEGYNLLSKEKKEYIDKVFIQRRLKESD